MSRIHVAFLLYLVLAATAGSSLRGDFRLAVLVFLGGLAIKTWISEQKRRGTDLSKPDSTMDEPASEDSGETQEK